MKRLPVLLFAIALIFFNGCTLAGNIFKAGTAVGVIAVVIIILIVIWVISLFRGKN